MKKLLNSLEMILGAVWVAIFAIATVTILVGIVKLFLYLVGVV